MGESHEIEDTSEFPELRTTASRFLIPVGHSVMLKYGAATDKGKVRERNEDHYAVVRRRRSRDILATNVPLDGVEMPKDEAYSFIVADGCGGEGFGDLASQLAVRTGWESAGRAATWIMKLDDIDDDEVRQTVAGLAKGIQQAFLTHCQDDPRLSGMATTWTCAYVTGWDAVIAHVGDSAYHCRNGMAKQITRDHTLAKELLESGASPEDVARFHSVLTKAFGGTSKEVVPDVHEVRLEPGDGILLCSDGLTNVVNDEEIGKTVFAHFEPQPACDALVALALERGGPDNVTAVLARVYDRK